MLIPKLRFPEFTERWKTIPLKELAVPVSDQVGTSHCVPYTVTSGVGLVSQDQKFGRTIAGKSLSNYICLQKHDFAYNKSATKAFPEGYIARHLDDVPAAVPNSIFTCFRADPKKIDPAYLDFLFAGNLHGRWLRKFLTVGARAHGSLNVNDDDLMALPVPLAEPAEQLKIAECLTSLDELLAAEARKLEVLRAHKKGLMQHLFPREGEFRPRLRFPEFREAALWKTRKISNILFKHSEPATLDIHAMYREIGVRSHGKGLFHKEPVRGNAIGEKRVFHVVPDALVINIVFAWEQAVAVTTPEEIGFIASHRFPMFVPKENRCNVSFMQRLFLTPLGKELLKVASPGGAGRNRTLSQKEFENLDVLIPETAEQHRIATCLSSLDVLIAAQTKARRPAGP